MTVTDRPRDDHGRLTGNAYSDADFLEAIADQDMPTTGDVARAVGCARTTAYGRLKRLEESGTVESRDVGSALVWTVVD
ncbi:helix-turn-helix domain-containing protein [Halopiger xanaduensis]